MVFDANMGNTTAHFAMQNARMNDSTTHFVVLDTKMSDTIAHFAFQATPSGKCVAFYMIFRSPIIGAAFSEKKIQWSQTGQASRWRPGQMA